MGIHARRIYRGHFANDFCRSCRGEKEDESVIHLLSTCPGLCQKIMKYMGTYYMNDLGELSRSDIGSLNRFIRSSEWFRD